MRRGSVWAFGVSYAREGRVGWSVFGDISPQRYCQGSEIVSGGTILDRARAEVQRTRPRRGWLFPSPGRRSPTGLLPGVQPAKTTITTNQDHCRLRSRQKSGCLRGQARGTTNRASPPNQQPAGQKTPSFPEPGPPEAPLTLTSRTMNNSQEPTRTQAQATVGVEGPRRGVSRVVRILGSAGRPA